MLKARADIVLGLPEEAWFDVSLMQKDIVLALDAARQLRVPLLSARQPTAMLTLARAAGYEHRDIAAALRGARTTDQQRHDTSSPP